MKGTSHVQALRGLVQSLVVVLRSLDMLEAMQEEMMRLLEGNLD